MDATTEAVREMYERYPYPSGAPELRSASDVRMLLSLLEGATAADASMTALDAGCGRGLGLLGAASMQPDVRFVGADINRVALDEARAAAAARQLGNVALHEVDLMTLEGLPVPEGGFDIIYSSGVIHHLSDPAQGLARLRDVLAPRGVLALMVYGRESRRPLMRHMEAARIVGREGGADLPSQLAPARSVSRAMADVLAGTPFEDTPTVPDVEFVDRVLNVQETSYTVADLWSLLQRLQLRPLRWAEPRDWDATALFDEPEMQARVAALPELDRFRLVEQMCWRPSLELLVCHADAPSRTPATAETLPETVLAVSPEATFETTVRNTWRGRRTEHVAYAVRGRPPTVATGAMARAILVLREQNRPFTGQAFAAAMSSWGVDQTSALHVLQGLLAAEVVYMPHLQA